MKFVGEQISGRANNFDFVRMIAAIMVILSHSYVLSTGLDSEECLIVLTKGQLDFGSLGVYIFFVISGFLIAKSFDNKKSVRSFLKARVLRLFPGLFIATVVLVFLLGPVVTTYSLTAYFMDSKILYFLRNCTMFWMKFDLPGVFAQNPYPNSVNGSLWTIPYEVKSYLVLLLVGLLGFFKPKRKLLLIGLFIFSMFYNDNFTHLFRYFSAGMLIYGYRDVIPLNSKLFVCSVLLAVIATSLGVLKILLPLLVGYTTIFVSLSSSIPLSKFGKYGDFSYGTYIYAFPVQQTVSYLFNGIITPLQNFFVSLPIVLVLAVLSWHFIESPTLKLKNR